MLNYYWTNILINNVQIEHTNLVKKFCDEYYGSQSDFYNIKQYYTPEATILYDNVNINGFDNLISKLKSDNIFKIKYDIVNVYGQSINKNAILIQTNGLLTYNYSFVRHKFVENFILMGDNYNRYYITNQIFTINT